MPAVPRTLAAALAAIALGLASYALVARRPPELASGGEDAGPATLSRVAERPPAAPTAESPRDPSEDARRMLDALLRTRRGDRDLGRLCNDEAFDALERVIRRAPEAVLRREAVSALGECRRPEALRLARLLLADDELAADAIRAIAAQGDREALTALLLDSSRATWIRAEAAIALGKTGDASARALLLQMLARSDDDELTAGLLRGLAAGGISETAPVFRSILADPALARARKLDAVEALVESSSGAEDLLLEVARGAGDEALRVAAVESLAQLDTASEIASEVGALLASEQSAEVRAAIYRHLSSPDASIAPAALDALLPSMLAEESPAARLEAYRAAALHCWLHPHPDRTRIFDDSMVPWLQREAEQGESEYARRTSLTTLGVASTPASRAALRDLTRSSDGETAAAARRVLDRHAEGPAL